MLLVLDTNHLRELREDSAPGRRLAGRIEATRYEPFSCIVVAEETLQGWIAFIRKRRSGKEQIFGYQRLQGTLEALANLSLLPFDADAALVFEELRKRLPRSGAMDLKIAAICLVHDATLLTRNQVDFERVPGLRVENWLD